jgi:hypothetical protein
MNFLMIIMHRLSYYMYSSLVLGFKCWRRMEEKGKWLAVMYLLMSLKYPELLLFMFSDCSEV